MSNDTFVEELNLNLCDTNKAGANIKVLDDKHAAVESRNRQADWCMICQIHKVRSDISGLATDRRAGDCLCPPSRLSDPQTDIRDTSSPWVETMAGSSGSPHDLGSPSLFLDLPEDDDDTSDDVPLLSEGTGVEQLNVLTKSGDSYSALSHSTSLAVGTEMHSRCEARSHHCHAAISRHAKSRQVTEAATRKLTIACGLCLIFIAGEVTGGYFSHSLAIMSDAAHMLSDFASFCISLLSIRMGSKSARKGFNFGYQRAEALGALLTLMIIWFVTGVLVWLAGNRIAHPKSFDVDPDPMMIVAGCAVFFNIVLGLLLHGLPHGHSHGGGGGGHEDHRGHINVRAAAIHVLGDLIQSVGVLISSVVIKLVGPGAKLADPVCTLLFSVIVMATTASVLKDTVRILMEGKPKSVNFNDVHEALGEIDSVLAVHDLRIWSLTVDQTVLTVHLAVDPASSVSKETVLQRANKCLNAKFGVYMTTIQVENFDTQTMSCCEECSLPPE